MKVEPFFNKQANEARYKITMSDGAKKFSLSSALHSFYNIKDYGYVYFDIYCDDFAENFTLNIDDTLFPKLKKYHFIGINFKGVPPKKISVTNKLSVRHIGVNFNGNIEEITFKNKKYAYKTVFNAKNIKRFYFNPSERLHRLEINSENKDVLFDFPGEPVFLSGLTGNGLIINRDIKISADKDTDFSKYEDTADRKKIVLSGIKGKNINVETSFEMPALDIENTEAEEIRFQDKPYDSLYFENSTFLPVFKENRCFTNVFWAENSKFKKELSKLEISPATEYFLNRYDDKSKLKEKIKETLSYEYSYFPLIQVWLNNNVFKNTELMIKNGDISTFLSDTEKYTVLSTGITSNKNLKISLESRYIDSITVNSDILFDKAEITNPRELSFKYTGSKDRQKIKVFFDTPRKDLDEVPSHLKKYYSEIPLKFTVSGSEKCIITSPGKKIKMSTLNLINNKNVYLALPDIELNFRLKVNKNKNLTVENKIISPQTSPPIIQVSNNENIFIPLAFLEFNEETLEKDVFDMFHDNYGTFIPFSFKNIDCSDRRQKNKLLEGISIMESVSSFGTRFIPWGYSSIEAEMYKQGLFPLPSFTKELSAVKDFFEIITSPDDYTEKIKDIAKKLNIKTENKNQTKNRLAGLFESIVKFKENFLLIKRFVNNEKENKKEKSVKKTKHPSV